MNTLFLDLVFTDRLSDFLLDFLLFARYWRLNLSCFALSLSIWTTPLPGISNSLKSIALHSIQRILVCVIDGVLCCRVNERRPRSSEPNGKVNILRSLSNVCEIPASACGVLPSQTRNQGYWGGDPYVDGPRLWFLWVGSQAQTCVGRRGRPSPESYCCSSSSLGISASSERLQRGRMGSLQPISNLSFCSAVNASSRSSVQFFQWPGPQSSGQC